MGENREAIPNQEGEQGPGRLKADVLWSPCTELKTNSRSAWAVWVGGESQGGSRQEHQQAGERSGEGASGGSGWGAARSAEAPAVALGHLLGGVHHVGHEAALHPLPALLDGDVPTLDQLEDVAGQVREGLLHVDGVAGRGLHVAHAVGARQLLRLLPAHLPLRLQVALVAHEQEDDAVRLHVAPGLLQPLVHVLEGAPVGDVEQEEAAHRVAVVGPGDRPEARARPGGGGGGGDGGAEQSEEEV